jgi:PAS domain S-box-containing protein
MDGSALERLFPGSSEVARRMRAFNWAGTPLGRLEQWPDALKHSVQLCLTASVPIVVFWEPEMTMLYNDRCIPLLGATHHPVSLGRSGREPWSDIWDAITPLFETVRASGEAAWSQQRQVLVARNLPGQEVYVTFTVGAILLDSGAVGGFFCPCTDVTEKIVAERRLDTLSALGATIHESPTAVDACEGAMTVLERNQHDIPFAAIYLLDDTGQIAVLASRMGAPLREHAFPASVALVTEETWRLAEVARTRRSAHVNLPTFGAIFPGGPWPEPSSRAVVLPLMAAQTRVVGFLIAGVNPRQVLDWHYSDFCALVAHQIATAITDATAKAEFAMILERRQREHALRASDEHYRRYFDLGLVGMAMTSPSKRILEVNDEFCRILGYEREQLLLMTWGDLTHPEDFAGDVFQFDRVMAGEIDGYSLDKRWIHKDGHVIHTIMAVRCVRRPDGSVDHFVKLLQDITTRKVAEQQRAHVEDALAEARLELSRVMRVTMMGELAAWIAHEVNQPLAAVITNGDAGARWLSLTPPNLAEATAALERIIEDANRASEVIARMRDFLKRGPTSRKAVAIDGVMGEVIAMVQNQTRTSHVSVESVVAPDVPPVATDRVLLQQVLLNLVLNAIEAMTATIHRPRILRLHAEPYGPGDVLVSVEDSGVGLKPEDGDRIFDAFFTTKTGGLGMGLSISRSIIEADGGRLWATANPVYGATFQFVLPAARALATRGHATQA